MAPWGTALIKCVKYFQAAKNILNMITVHSRRLVAQEISILNPHCWSDRKEKSSWMSSVLTMCESQRRVHVCLVEGVQHAGICLCVCAEEGCHPTYTASV